MQLRMRGGLLKGLNMRAAADRFILDVFYLVDFRHRPGFGIRVTAPPLLDYAYLDHQAEI